MGICRRRLRPASLLPGCDAARRSSDWGARETDVRRSTRGARLRRTAPGGLRIIGIDERVQPLGRNSLTYGADDIVERLLETAGWPAEVRATIVDVADEYLSLVTPLQQIAAATAGTQMSRPWGIVASRPQTAEQKARLELGLPAAGAAKDGCPPAPKVILPKAPSGSSSSGRGSASSSGWTYRWESPSGNLHCGYAPRSSMGVPVIACLDSQTNTLARLYANRSAMITTATRSQRAQLQGDLCATSTRRSGKGRSRARSLIRA